MTLVFVCMGEQLSEQDTTTSRFFAGHVRVQNTLHEVRETVASRLELVARLSLSRATCVIPTLSLEQRDSLSLSRLFRARDSLDATRRDATRRCGKDVSASAGSGRACGAAARGAKPAHELERAD